MNRLFPSVDKVFMRQCLFKKNRKFNVNVLLYLLKKKIYAYVEHRFSNIDNKYI